jgi:RNA polymerase sigma-70 factor (ECF subfamily)
MHDLSDQQLVDAINAGDSRAFEALYFRYRDWVVRLATRFTGSGDDALDVLQETFAYVFRRFPGFRLTASMTTFLYPVVKNLSIAARRKRMRMTSSDAVDMPEPAASESADPRQQRSELEIVLASLPDTHREVLLMRFVDAMSLQEIAAALGIPEGTVKSRIHNAVASLRDDPRVRRFFLPGE